MTVSYIDINELGINPVPLSILIPDNQTARIMTFQSTGHIDVNDRVGNFDHELAEKKYQDFFALAKNRNASMAVTPEYSCPWQVVESILNTQSLRPHLGSLWVVGCESITLEDFNKFIKKTKGLVKWHFETVVPNANQIFFSPVVYILHAQDDQGDQTELCAIVQFKCHDMGGTTFERDKLIKGTKRYVLHNPTQGESIRLLTLICSDVFDFDENDLKHHLPYLIVHVQLNTAPYHHNFCRYRRDIFNSFLRHKCEILCLNWAQGFEFHKGGESSEHGGSAYYMHPRRSEKEPTQSDNAINKNHAKGMYLRFSDTSLYSAFLFTPNEVIIEFDTTKVSQVIAPPTHVSRTGPKVIEAYGWNFDDASWVIIEKIDDGVEKTFEGNGGEANTRPSDREKLLAISNGEVSPDFIKWHMPKGLGDEDKAVLRVNYWHKPRNMESYCLDGNESPKGTLAKIQATQELGISESISKLSNLKGYLAKTGDLPDIFEDFKTIPTKINLDPTEVSLDKIRHNVMRLDGKGLATVADLGPTLPEVAQRKFADIKDTLSPQRLVVWFTYEGKLQHIADKLPEVTIAGEAPDDITRM